MAKLPFVFNLRLSNSPFEVGHRDVCLGSKADVSSVSRHVHFVPIVDIVGP